MTSSAPLPPQRGGALRGPWLVVAGLLAILAYVFSGLSNALVYYLTPTELAARARGRSARRSGWVARSCRKAAGGSRDVFGLRPDRWRNRDHGPLDRRSHQLIPGGSGGGRRGDRSSPTACSRLTRSWSSTTRRTSRRPTIRRCPGRHPRSRRRRHRRPSACSRPQRRSWPGAAAMPAWRPRADGRCTGRGSCRCWPAGRWRFRS